MLARQASLSKKDDDGGRRGSVEFKLASPFGVMLEAVMKKAKEVDLWNDEMQRDLPKKWEKHGDMVIFPQNSFTHQNWRFIGRDLWRVVAEALKVARLGRKRVIDERTPHVDIMYGDNGWVEHVDERGITYVYDASKRVFNVEKAKEMRRIEGWSCNGETVVDMYAGLGYFTFPFAIACQAKKVYAMDWDEDTVEALVRTRSVNKVDDVVEIIQGDARRVCPQGVADRVYLGLVPSCRAHLLTASRALSPQGGIIHVQESIDTKAKRVIPTRRPLIKQVSKLDSLDETAPSTSTTPKNDQLAKEAANAPPETRAAPSTEDTENVELDEDGNPKVHPDFEATWAKLQQPFKAFAMDCASSVTRFLNNIHESDDLYGVTVVNLLRLSSNKTVDTVVLDLVCAKDAATAARLAGKLLPKEHDHKKE